MLHVLRVFCCVALLLAILPLASADDSKTAGIDLIGPLSQPEAGGVWRCFLEDPHASLADVWSVQDGVLKCKGMPKGYIYTTKDYDDFVLKLEWRWPADKAPGKGGVLVRTTGPNKIWPKSLEAQINSPDAGDFWGLGGYALTGPADRSKSLEHPEFGKLTNVKKAVAAEKPAGQWNQYEIIARGHTVTLKINGKTVNRATRCETEPGKICLTAEGDEIHFRNIRLIPLAK